MSTKTTYLIIALNVMIYLMMFKVGGVGADYSFGNRTLLQFGADFAPLVREGQWWRLVTSVFIHITPLHIIMNMIALYQVGVVLEPHYGRLRYVLLYLAAGLGGSVASLAWNWREPIVSAGASGAISGLIAAGAVSGHMLVGLSKGAKQYRDSMVRWLFMIVAFGLWAHVDAAAHAGGMAVGAGVSWWLDRKGGAIRRAQTESQRDKGLGLETLLLFAVVAGSFFLASRASGDVSTTEELINEGVELAHSGKDAEAIEKYRRALKQKPNDDVAHFDLALALCRQEKFAECEEHARAATRIDPSRKDPWKILAYALHGQGREDEAGAALKEYEKHGGSIAEDIAEPDGGS